MTSQRERGPERDALLAVAERVGAGLVDVRRLHGGSIHEAWSVSLDDGRSVFVKTDARAPADLFFEEARGLAWLEAGLSGDAGLSVPSVIACEPEFLVLELLEPGPPVSDFDERLGRGLAALHRSGSDLHFGLDSDNYVGGLPQPNETRADWPAFYRDCRLAPMLARAGPSLPTALRRRFDVLFERLETECGDPEPPARLHGDLWSGNLLRDRQGGPVLIDPAVHAGHREMDLAMMRLFGGFSPECFAAYASTWPLQPGWERRVDLWQLYPLLVHVVLFGGSYVGSVEAALRRLARGDAKGG